jgi:hypothetical protein
MVNTAKRVCARTLCLTILALAASTARAGTVPTATPGDYSFTVYDPSGNVVYQVEQSAATINPSTIYELYPETSITVGSTSYLLTNITFFSGGAIEFPNASPTAIYAAGGNPIAGPWDAIFGLIYDPNTQIWNDPATNPPTPISINYFLGFAAGPPGTGEPYGPAGAGTYFAEPSGPFFAATEYLNPALQSLGYSAYFYDPASIAVPEPSSLTLTLEAGGIVLLALAGLRRRPRMLGAQIA